MRDADIAEDLRRRLADRIEADLALLDELDGDADLEPTMAHVGPFQLDECEGDEMGRDVEAEPSLGWAIGGAYGSRDFFYGLQDLEEGDDNGIGDRDGLAEQAGFYDRAGYAVAFA